MAQFESTKKTVCKFTGVVQKCWINIKCCFQSLTSLEYFVEFPLREAEPHTYTIG